MSAHYTVIIGAGARRDIAKIAAHYRKVDREYGAGSDICRRFYQAFQDLLPHLEANPRLFSRVKRYRFAVLSRSFRHVVLFFADESTRRVRILGVFPPGKQWDPGH